MNYAIFIYNILMIVLFAMNMGVFSVHYLRSKKPLAMWIACMFLLFIINDLILYMTEIFDSFSIFYNLHTLNDPVIKTTVSIGIYLCYLFIAAEFTHGKIRMEGWIAYGLYAAALLIVPLVPTTRFTYWLYFTLSQVMFAYIGMRCYADANRLPPEKSLKLRHFLKVSLILNLFIVLEDAAVIFFLDDLDPATMDIHQRNWCEGLQSIYFGVEGLRYFWRAFFPAPEAPADQSEMARVIQAGAVLRKKQMSLFCARHGLTRREGEVLSLLLGNKSNTEIGNELFISPGTVKNHTHNIYQKTGAGGRTQLFRMLESVAVEDVLTGEEYVGERF